MPTSSDFAQIREALEAAAAAPASETVEPQDYLRKLWLTDRGVASEYMILLNDVKTRLSDGPLSCSQSASPFSRVQFEMDVSTTGNLLSLDNRRFTVIEGAPLSETEQVCLRQILEGLSSIPIEGIDAHSRLPSFPFTWSVTMGRKDL